MLCIKFISIMAALHNLASSSSFLSSQKHSQDYAFQFPNANLQVGLNWVWFDLNRLIFSLAWRRQKLVCGTLQLATIWFFANLIGLAYDEAVWLQFRRHPVHMSCIWTSFVISYVELHVWNNLDQENNFECGRCSQVGISEIGRIPRHPIG